MVNTNSLRIFAWRKAAQYFIAMIITLILGKSVASIPLFESTLLFNTLTSAELVNFVTKMAALIFVFIFTKHSINALEGTCSGVSFLRGVAVPIATLIIITVAQESVRDLLGPFIGETGNTLLTFASSVIVLAACLWVIFTGYRCSSFLFDFFVSLSKTLRERFTENSISRTCFNCANPVDHHVKYCPVCGVELESRRCKNCHSVMSVSGKYCGQCGHLQEELS